MSDQASDSDPEYVPGDSEDSDDSWVGLSPSHGSHSRIPVALAPTNPPPLPSPPSHSSPSLPM
ncbi:hypothetical protein E2C01_095708 [Portunus trituberculatus]|uniref:Uncharacterized protein n=1 Tax=Portunus trituberculatus TaxID=210409 RepID=A0A5B7K4Q6_PORTR|nr:hypothetical protein [Portunus trituberculatus]